MIVRFVSTIVSSFYYFQLCIFVVYPQSQSNYIM